MEVGIPLWNVWNIDACDHKVAENILFRNTICIHSLQGFKTPSHDLLEPTSPYWILLFLKNITHDEKSSAIILKIYLNHMICYCTLTSAVLFAVRQLPVLLKDYRTNKLQAQNRLSFPNNLKGLFFVFEYL